MLRNRWTSVLALASLAMAGSISSAQTVTVPVTDDFFTTTWSFGPPYVRGRADPTRSSIGVTTPNPFLQSTNGSNNWEETTYFVFSDFASYDLPSTVTSAVLRVRAVTRLGGQVPSAENPFAISAQRVLSDPTAIVGTAASGAGSFVEFKNTQLAGVEDTVSVGVATPTSFEWDVTDLVNEWIANGEANFDHSIAMTGRFGNPADTASTGFFHAFDNSESAAAQLPARLVIAVPEPAALGFLAVLSPMLVRRKRRH